MIHSIRATITVDGNIKRANIAQPETVARLLAQLRDKYGNLNDIAVSFRPSNDLISAGWENRWHTVTAEEFMSLWQQGRFAAFQKRFSWKT